MGAALPAPRGPGFWGAGGQRGGGFQEAFLLTGAEGTLLQVSGHVFTPDEFTNVDTEPRVCF